MAQVYRRLSGRDCNPLYAVSHLASVKPIYIRRVLTDKPNCLALHYQSGYAGFYRSSSGCTQRYGVISSCVSVSLIMCRAGPAAFASLPRLSPWAIAAEYRRPVVRRGTTNPEGWRAAKIGGCCLGTALVHGGAENPAYGRQPSARDFARSPADSFK